MLDPKTRADLLDSIAALVDENLSGRSDMCRQFADLLQRALAHLRLPARPVLGTAIYFSNRREVFRWEHAWVRVGSEVIDGNVDSLYENPMVPPEVTVAPYWGPITNTPADRRLRQDKKRSLPADSDVAQIWWPELRARIDDGQLGALHPQESL